MAIYKISVNGKFQFDLETSSKLSKINGVPVEANISRINQHIFHIINENRSYTAEVIDLNRQEKSAAVKINGNLYTIQIKDQYAILLAQLGLDKLDAHQVSEIKAPMPGLVFKILVQEGDEIKKGDNLIVLEAMKMENIIKSPSEGWIKKIQVKVGDKVEKNQLMIIFK